MIKSKKEWGKGAGMAGEEKASKQARMVIQPSAGRQSATTKETLKDKEIGGDDQSTVQSGTPSLAGQSCSQKGMNDPQPHQVEPLLIVKQRIWDLIWTGSPPQR